MNPQPLVTIAIPTYNRPDTLLRTLKSVISQTYSNLEIIVSDNCSPHAEVETVMAQFASDKRVKYYRQPVNRGALFNFNFILEKITGEYFMRLADDDWIDINYVECCLSFLLKNPAYICAYGRTKLFNLNGEFVKFDPELSLDQHSYSDRIIYYYQNVTQNGIYYGLIRKDCIQSVVAKNKLAEDWLTVARLAYQGKIKMLENTNLNISFGGMGGSIDGIVQSLGLSKFNKYFPYLTVGINASLDILWDNRVYQKLSFSKRISLSKVCFRVIYCRFSVYNEVRAKYRAYIKALIFGGQ